MKPPQLDSERLTVQPINIKDANALFAYRSHPDVVRFQSVMFDNQSAAVQFIQIHQGFDFGIPNTWFQLGIYRKPGEELIGDIGIHFLDEEIKTVEIGFTIAPLHQRQGYALESVRAMLAHLFTVLHTDRVVGITDSRNHSSIGLLARLDFEKTAPGSLPFEFELLPEEMVFTISQAKWESTQGT